MDKQTRKRIEGEMMNGKIIFKDVGRNKKCFEIKFKNKPVEFLHILIEKEAGKHLLSSSIEALDGTIFVGGFRAVGSYKVVEQ